MTMQLKWIAMTAAGVVTAAVIGLWTRPPRLVADFSEPALVLSGTIVPAATAVLPGHPQSLAVPLNSWVQRGTVLASRDAEFLQPGHEPVARLRSDTVPSGPSLIELEQHESQAEAVDEDRSRELRRRQLLYRSAMLPELDYDAAVTAQHTADVSVDQARRAVATAAVEQDLATLSNQETRLERRPQAAAKPRGARSGLIVAPTDGIVVATGEGSEAQLGIAADPRRLQAFALVAQTDLMSIRLGERAALTLDATPQVHFGATVSAISPEPIDGEGKFYQVTFAVDNPQGAALSGAPMHAQLTR